MTITASSVDDPALTASAVIQLSAAATIEVVPGWAVLYMAQTQQFKATTANAGGQEVKWSISPKDAGTIDANGLYKVPATIPATQKVTVTATSAAKPAISGSTAIYISPRPFTIF
ncbi:MAG: Ig-like domain-containing protein, partial [Bryobacteraceae bacterium]